jgi:hypothetical protein
MNVVVNFLSMLGSEAESGGVHRMLSVCAEFERIAKKVIERVEKEQSSRRKRKSHEPPSKSSVASTPQTTHSTPKPANAATPTPQPITIKNEMPPSARSGTPNGGQLSPPPHQMERPHSSRSFSPMAGMAPEPSPGMPSAGWPGPGQHDYPPREPKEFGSFSEMTGFGPNGGIPSPHMGMAMQTPFQQPLLPHDLYALPMTLDWDWAEMSGGAYPSVENGAYGEGGPPR